MGLPTEADAWDIPNNPTRLPEPYQRFILDRRLGRGGMAVVYKARDETAIGKGIDLGALAIKFVRPPKTDDGRELAPGSEEWERWLELFRQEAAFGGRIDGPYLGRSFEHLDLSEHVEAGWPPIAIPMAFYPFTLSQVIHECRRRPLPAIWATKWSRQLTQAIDGLHSRGFVHRDVKPPNVMLSVRGEVGDYSDLTDALAAADIRLADYTTVCRSGPERVPGGVWSVQPDRGRNYKAPELSSPDHHVRQRAQTDPRQDIYSLGMVLEELAEATEGRPAWLFAAARACQNMDPKARPTLGEVYFLVSPDYDEHARILTESGHRTTDHPHFVPRQVVRSEFETFAARCDHDGPHGRGGVFVLEADAGFGKTALLTHWADEQPATFAFYFRFRDGRTTPATMPAALCDQLCRAHGIQQDSLPTNPADRLRAVLQRLSDLHPDSRERRLIFIDGLDESANPWEAVTSIPVTGLPRNTFFIISSRPTAGQDYLAPLESAGARRYFARLNEDWNRRDVITYFNERVGTRLRPGQAEQLAEATGGMFQLAVLFADDLLRPRDPTTPENILSASPKGENIAPAQRMYGYYAESWNRILNRLRGRVHGADYCLYEFARVLTVAQDWLEMEQVSELIPWLEEHRWRRGGVRYWDATTLGLIRDELTWLLDQRPSAWYGNPSNVGYIQIRHQSIRDFFLHAPQMTPVQLGIRGTHADVGAYYLWQAEERRFWSRVDPYGRYYAVRHLLTADRESEALQAIRLLLNLDYLQATIGDEPPGTWVIAPTNAGGEPCQTAD